MKIVYLYSKFVKKILRGKCVRNSQIDASAVVNSGSSVVNSTMGRILIAVMIVILSMQE